MTIGLREDSEMATTSPPDQTKSTAVADAEKLDLDKFTSGKDIGRAPRWFQAVYWPFFALVFLYLVVMLFQPLVSSQDVWGRNLQYVGFSVVVVCLALWIGDVLHYVHLSSGVRRAIFITFILAVLGAAAAFIVNPPGPPTRPVIRNVMLFKEDTVDANELKPRISGLSPRPNSVVPFSLSEKKVQLLVGFVVGNLTVDTDRRIDTEVKLILKSPVGLYDVETRQRSTIAEWKDKELIRQLGVDVVEQAFSGVKDTETVFLMHVGLDPRLVATGNGELGLLIRDRMAGTWSEAVVNFSMQETDSSRPAQSAPFVRK